MFDDSGFGGNSMFDMNHDGRLNGFEVDTRDCFLHDKDVYEKVKIQRSDYQKKQTNSNLEISKEAWLLIVGTVFITVLVEVIKIIGR